MDIPTFAGATSSATDNARKARQIAYSPDRAESFAAAAQVDATVALALAVREAGSAIGAGLTAIARSLDRR